MTVPLPQAARNASIRLAFMSWSRVVPKCLRMIATFRSSASKVRGFTRPSRVPSHSSAKSATVIVLGAAIRPLARPSIRARAGLHRLGLVPGAAEDGRRPRAGQRMRVASDVCASFVVDARRHATALGRINVLQGIPPWSHGPGSWQLRGATCCCRRQGSGRSGRRAGGAGRVRRGGRAAVPSRWAGTVPRRTRARRASGREPEVASGLDRRHPRVGLRDGDGGEFALDQFIDELLDLRSERVEHRASDGSLMTPTSPRSRLLPALSPP